jgi:hypothetical protein
VISIDGLNFPDHFFGNNYCQINCLKVNEIINDDLHREKPTEVLNEKRIKVTGFCFDKTVQVI